MATDLLDDVFGESEDHPSDHPSDMRRLRSQHHTAGYRDGYIKSKTTSIQTGFDEGYSLGATVGLRAGQLLGVLEGLAEAVEEQKPSPSSSSSSLQQLLRDARRELATNGVFTPEYWNADGTWKYEVGARADKPAEEDGETVFADVAEAHPVVRKWRRLVEAEMERCGVRWDVFWRGEDEKGT